MCFKAIEEVSGLRQELQEDRVGIRQPTEKLLGAAKCAGSFVRTLIGYLGPIRSRLG